MPRNIETTVFKFDELSDRAKEKARDWWRSASGPNDDFYAECVKETASDAAKILGISILGWNWSGFSSQGDGAAFMGYYTYAKGAAKAIRDEFPTATALHAIADELQAAQRRAFYRLRAECRISRDNNMSVIVTDGTEYGNVPLTAESTIEDAMTDFAHWFYKTLESEYEYQNADEQVDESIRANEYEFTEEGERA